MKKILTVAIVVIILGSGLAFAQFYAGGKTLGNNFFVGFGLNDALDLRVETDFSIAPTSGFGFGVDALFNFGSASEIAYYGGGGLFFSIVNGNNTTGTAFGLKGVAGAEYLLTQSLGLFGEANLNLRLVGGIAFSPAFGLGMNFYF